MKTKTLLMTIAFGIVLVAACKKDTTTDYTTSVTCDQPTDDQNKYSLAIQPIIETSCTGYSGCHGYPNASSIDMSTYATAKAAFTDKDALCTINHGSGCEAMPYNLPKLPDSIIHKLACWVKNGYPE